MATEAQLEVLNDAFDAAVRDGDFMATDDPRGWIYRSSVLYDTCIDAGMSLDEPDHRAWAARRVTQWLVAA